MLRDRLVDTDRPRPAVLDELPRLLAHAFPAARTGTLQDLEVRARIVPFTRGQQLSAQDRGGRFLAVLRGALAIRRLSRNGKQTTIRIARGPCFSGIAVPEEIGAIATSSGLTEGVAAIWPSATLRWLATADPGLGVGLLDLNHACIVDLITRIDELTFEDARHRLAEVLLEHEDIAFDDIRPGLSRQELAEVVGVSNEMTGRLLREFEDAGALRRPTHLGLRLMDRSYLESLAGPSCESLAGRGRIASGDREPVAVSIVGASPAVAEARA
jgi:CRP-like cAMP-binding protein